MVLDEHTFEFSNMMLLDNMMWKFSTVNFRVISGSDHGAIGIIRLTEDRNLEVFSARLME